jgi:hypothetical protein
MAVKWPCMSRMSTACECKTLPTLFEETSYSKLEVRKNLPGEIFSE